MQVDSLPLATPHIAHFQRAGITELYPPQAETVDAGICEGENVMAAIPTASGKTLIAQLAMLTADGPGLYIVPLRALAPKNTQPSASCRVSMSGLQRGITTRRPPSWPTTISSSPPAKRSIRRSATARAGSTTSAVSSSTRYTCWPDRSRPDPGSHARTSPPAHPRCPACRAVGDRRQRQRDRRLARSRARRISVATRRSPYRRCRRRDRRIR